MKRDKQMRSALIIAAIILIIFGVMGFIPLFGWAYIPIWGLIFEIITGGLIAVLVWRIFLLFRRETKSELSEMTSNKIIPDTTSPIITLLGENPVNIFIGDSYIDKGVKAFDNVDGDITAKVKAVSNIDASSSGTYTITYSVADSAGNETNVKRVVNVMHKPPVAVDDGFAYTKNRIISIPIMNLTSNDSDPEGNQISFLRVSKGKGGTATYIPFLKRVFFRPDKTFIGLASFIYTIQNTIGLQSNATVWLSFGINELPNRLPPVVSNDKFSTNKVFTFILISKLLENDNDPDNGQINFVYVNKTSKNVSIFSLKIIDRLLLIVRWGFSGTITFQYTVKNSAGLQTTGAAIVEVNDASLMVFRKNKLLNF